MFYLLHLGDEVLLTPEQESAAHLRAAADCFEQSRSTILELAAEQALWARMQEELVGEQCMAAPEMSSEAVALTAHAISLVDRRSLVMATNPIGVDRALTSMIAGFNRQADRLAPLDEPMPN